MKNTDMVLIVRYFALLKILTYGDTNIEGLGEK
jgi:hypothetical protein